MNLIDALEKYRADLEEKISSIYYELNNDSSLFENSVNKLGKYHRRIEIVDEILSKLNKNKFIRK